MDVTAADDANKHSKLESKLLLVILALKLEKDIKMLITNIYQQNVAGKAGYSTFCECDLSMLTVNFCLSPSLQSAVNGFKL